MKNIKKIILIRPGVRFPRMLFAPPLGLLYLASVLRKEFFNQLEINLVDQALYNISFDQIKSRIKKFNPDLVCFSCLSVEADEMARLSKIAKELNPNCITILGGPHSSVFYDHALENANIDIAVIGEGERTFPELIKKLQNDELIDDVKGIAFKKDGKIVLTPPREPIENLDEIPFPAWDMVDFKKYSKETSMNVYCHSTPWAVIFTSRGCPYHCAYCHNIFGKKTRFRSPENVISEIEILTTKYGVKEIHIVDDIFNLDLDRAKKICDLIIQKNIKIKIAFPNGLRGDIMDEELIQKLKQAGCYSITFAIETASLRIQKLINKNLDLDKIKRAIEWADKEKIITNGFFMIGFPGETREEMEETIKYAIGTKLLIGLFFTVVIYPRIKLYEIAKSIYPEIELRKWVPSDFWYWSQSTFYEKVTGMNLYKVQKYFYWRFFRRPKTVFLIFWRFPKNKSLLLGALRGIRIVFDFLYKIEFFIRKKFHYNK